MRSIVSTAIRNAANDWRRRRSRRRKPLTTNGTRSQPGSTSCLPNSPALNRIMLRSGLDRDPAQLGEFRNTRLAAEAAVAGGLCAAEGHLGLVMHGRAVDVADAGFD